MSFVKILEDPKLPRRSGKTIMLAMHYVQLVLDNPGKQVKVEDHHYSQQADRDLFVLVHNVLSTLGIDFSCDKKSQTFMNTGRLERINYPSAASCIQEETIMQWENSRRGLPGNIIY